MDVIGRAPTEAAVKGIRFVADVGQGGFHKGGGSADESGEPHPEHRTGTTGGNGGHHTHHIAHANPGGGGYNEGLDSGKGTGAVAYPLFQRQPEHLRQHPNGDKPGADGEKQSRGNQNRHQQGDAQRLPPRQGNGKQIAPEKVVDPGNDGKKDLHRITS